MKSTVSHFLEDVEPIEFPCVMEYLGDNNQGKGNGLIVLFKSETSGVCLDSGNSTHKVGLFLDTWVSVYKDMYWRPFHGTITIEV